MNRLSAAYFRVAFCCCLVCLVAGCVDARGSVPIDDRQVEEAAELTFSWIDCGSPAKPYFLVDIWRDGRFKFVGKVGTRVLGQQEGRLSAEDVKKASQTADRFMRAEARISSEDGQYCLSVQRKGSNTAKAVVANLGSKRAMEFDGELNSYVRHRRWICPGRGFAFYGQVGACAAAAVTYVYDEPGTCRIRHIVRLSDNGDVHYYAEDLDGTDQFVTTDLRTVESIKEMVKTFTIVGSEGIEGDLSTSHRGTESELLNFRHQVESKLGIRWVSARPGDAKCKAELEPAQAMRWVIY